MCTRILWNTNALGVFVARTMDWPTTTEPKLMIFPRGRQRQGNHLGTTALEMANPARWQSRYGSAVVSMYGLGTVDGFNEQGLAVHLLYLTATDFGAREPQKPGVHAGLWGQYLLDNAATVKEALDLMSQIQPVMITVQGFASTVHVAIADASGDSAILEYLNGELVIHHGRQYQIMTNDPPYDEQLAYRAQFDFTNATRQTPLPGNVDPSHRFVRADYFLQVLPEPRNEREAIASVLAIARNVSVPFGAPNKVPGSLYNTEYRTAMDLSHRYYVFELTTAPNVLWFPLEKFALHPEAPVMMLDPDHPELVGDVSAQFVPLAADPY